MADNTTLSQFKINQVPVRNDYTVEQYFPHETLKGFKYSDGTYIQGIKQTNPWQVTVEIADTGIKDYYKYSGSDATEFKPVLPGYSPSFANLLYDNKDGWAHRYSLKYNSTKQALELENLSTYRTEKTWYAKDFRDNVIPNRLIVLLQGAGGGGGGSSSVYIIVHAGGSNGGGGGAGGFAAVVLNIKKLIDNPKCSYTFEVGSGGDGAKDSTVGADWNDEDFMILGQGTMNGDPGEVGKRSSIQLNQGDGKGNVDLIIIGGGYGGEHGNGYTNGAGGKGGEVTITKLGKETKDDWWWDLPRISEGTYYDNSRITGTAGTTGVSKVGDIMVNQNSPQSLKVLCEEKYAKPATQAGMTYDTEQHSTGLMGGENHENQSGGGGCSLFANGGNGGNKTGDRTGKPGTKGAGGGGGHWAWGGMLSIVGMQAMISIRGGGKGGNGYIAFYY